MPGAPGTPLVVEDVSGGDFQGDIFVDFTAPTIGGAVDCYVLGWSGPGFGISYFFNHCGDSNHTLIAGPFLPAPGFSEPGYAATIYLTAQNAAGSSPSIPIILPNANVSGNIVDAVTGFPVGSANVQILSPFGPVNSLTGTLFYDAATIEQTGAGWTLNGANTLFTSQLQIGETITDGAGISLTITAINNDVNLIATATTLVPAVQSPGVGFSLPAPFGCEVSYAGGVMGQINVVDINAILTVTPCGANFVNGDILQVGFPIGGPGPASIAPQPAYLEVGPSGTIFGGSLRHVSLLEGGKGYPTSGTYTITKVSNAIINEIDEKETDASGAFSFNNVGLGAGYGLFIVSPSAPSPLGTHFVSGHLVCIVAPPAGATHITSTSTSTGVTTGVSSYFVGSTGIFRSFTDSFTSVSVGSITGTSTHTGTFTIASPFPTTFTFTDTSFGTGTGVFTNTSSFSSTGTSTGTRISLVPR